MDDKSNILHHEPFKNKNKRTTTYSDHTHSNNPTSPRPMAFTVLTQNVSFRFLVYCLSLFKGQLCWAGFALLTLLCLQC